MKKFFLFALVVAAMLSAQNGFAAGTNDVVAGTNDVVTGLNALVARVNAKIHQGLTTEKDLDPEFRDFDALYDKYKDRKTEDVAQIMMMKAELYLDVLDDYEKDPIKAADALQKIKRDMPQTESGQRVDGILASLKRLVEAEQIRNTLVVGAAFPGFDEKDVAGKPLSLASHKGRVVLVDFWATWCGPCVRELPNVIATYQKYHAKGFDIVGVSLDEDQPTLERFLKENSVPWPQFFDGKKWDNKLAMKYGVTLAPTTYLLDGDGKILGKNLRGPELEAAVAKVIAKK